MQEVKQQFDIPLHDIKPLVEIEEYSLYYLMGVIALGVIIFIAISYLLYLWYKKRDQFNVRKHHLKCINELDLSDTKSTAYALSLYGLTFKDDSPRHHEMFLNIHARLENYKYKKSVDAFDKETLGYIEVYRGMLDV